MDGKFGGTFYRSDHIGLNVLTLLRSVVYLAALIVGVCMCVAANPRHSHSFGWLYARIDWILIQRSDILLLHILTSKFIFGNFIKHRFVCPLAQPNNRQCRRENQCEQPKIDFSVDNVYCEQVINKIIFAACGHMPLAKTKSSDIHLEQSLLLLAVVWSCYK